MKLVYLFDKRFRYNFVLIFCLVIISKFYNIDTQLRPKHEMMHYSEGVKSQLWPLEKSLVVLVEN